MKSLKIFFPTFSIEIQSERPSGAEDDGNCCCRKSNRGEGTVEAWGLVDGQPTGKHFSILDYDDVIPDYPPKERSPRSLRRGTAACALAPLQNAVIEEATWAQANNHTFSPPSVS